MYLDKSLGMGEKRYMSQFEPYFYNKINNLNV